MKGVEGELGQRGSGHGEMLRVGSYCALQVRLQALVAALRHYP